jgi:hypothetical protein
VHAFASTAIGWAFLTYLGCVVAAALNEGDSSRRGAAEKEGLGLLLAN